jgi:hypothetical protein
MALQHGDRYGTQAPPGSASQSASDVQPAVMQVRTGRS